jgi:hypothetical protein
MNLGQISRRVSGDEFANACSRDAARALVRALRVFEQRNPKRLGEVLQMARRCVRYDLF